MSLSPVSLPNHPFPSFRPRFSVVAQQHPDFLPTNDISHKFEFTGRIQIDRTLVNPLTDLVCTPLRVGGTGSRISSAPIDNHL